MKLNVPFYSLKKNSSTNDVRDKSSVVDMRALGCAKMVLDFWSNESPSFEELAVRGGYMGVCDSPHNFAIDSLVVLLRAYGFNSHKLVFKNLEFDFFIAAQVQKMYDEEQCNHGVDAILESIQNTSPVIVTLNRFDLEGEHPIVLMGYEQQEGVITGFYYHDALLGDKDRFIDMDEFILSWNRIAIFLNM